MLFNSRAFSNISEGSSSQVTEVTQDGNDALFILEAAQVQDDILDTDKYMFHS